MTKAFIALTIVCLIGSLLYKRWATNKALKELYALKVKDKGEYIKALDSYYVKFSFSEFNRNLMKLNYWIDERNDEKVKEVLEIILFLITIILLLINLAILFIISCA